MPTPWRRYILVTFRRPMGAECVSCAGSMGPLSACCRVRRARTRGRMCAGGGRVLALELIVVIGVTTLLTKAIARRIGVAQPLLLVAFGVLIGLVPLFRHIELAPEV